MERFLFSITTAALLLTWPVDLKAQQLEPVDITWDSLQAKFNEMDQYPRIVTIISPNCIPCRLHRDDIRDDVMDQCPNPDLKWIIVWFEDPGHPSVRNDAVSQAALINDSRVTQFWYTEHQNNTPKNDSIAYLLAAAQWVSCSYAWDMSLLYPAGTSWTNTNPPAPHYCMAKVFGCCNPYSVGNFAIQVNNIDVCDPSIGINETAFSSTHIHVFPNPNTGNISLSFEAMSLGTYEMRIMDLTGKLRITDRFEVYDRHALRELKLPGELANGNYILELMQGDMKAYTLITIER